MDWDIRTASEDWLVEHVEQMKIQNGILGGLEEGVRVVQLSDSVAVKYGFGVTAQEVENQRFAYDHVDHSIVRVPQVLRFFMKQSGAFNSGYFFMENIPGWALADLDLRVHSDVIPRVANIIAHLGSIPSNGQPPGPIGGGKAKGYIWGDYGALTAFKSTEEFNEWLNKRLIIQEKTIDITSQPLVFCHMDLCRRNMIMLPDRSICLVDFGHAGFFPRFFEILSLARLNPFDPEYDEPLISAAKERLKLTEEEQQLMSLMDRAIAINMRFPFGFGETLDQQYIYQPSGSPPPPLPDLESQSSSEDQIVPPPMPDELPTPSPPSSPGSAPPPPSPPSEAQAYRPPPRGPPPPPPPSQAKQNI